MYSIHTSMMISLNSFRFVNEMFLLSPITGNRARSKITWTEEQLTNTEMTPNINRQLWTRWHEFCIIVCSTWAPSCMVHRITCASSSLEDMWRHGCLLSDGKRDKESGENVDYKTNHCGSLDTGVLRPGESGRGMKLTTHIHLMRL